MENLLDSAINVFFLILFVIYPPSLAPVLLSLTEGMSVSERQQTAIIGSITAFIILSCCALFGESILHALGISIPAFKIGGGLLLLKLSFEIVFHNPGATNDAQKTKISVTKNTIRSIAAFPLAVPLIAGPGAISTSILVAEQMRHVSPNMGSLVVIGIIFIVILSALLCMLLANTIQRVIGERYQSILTRLLGVLLVSLSIQFVVDGIQQVATGFIAH